MKYTHPNIVKAVLETLEDRRMMSSVTFDDGVLNIAGNAASNNKISLRLSTDSREVQVSVNGSSTNVELSKLSGISIIGGEKIDVISIDASLNAAANVRTLGGNDWIFSGGGNDVIDSGAGNDFVDARNGNDYVATQTGDDRVYGGDGNDVIDTDGGNDTVLAGRGDDKIYGGDGNDHLDGKEGNDTISAGQGNDRVFGAEGDDVIDGKEGGDTLSGGAGADTLVDRESIDTITDSDSSDNITDPTPDNTANPAPKPTPTPEPKPTPSDDSGKNPDNNSGTDDDNTWDDSQDNTGQDGAPAPAITVLDSTEMAGHAIHVNALKSSLGSGQMDDAKFEWNFGDPGSRHNVLPGFNAAHVYDKAGAYTITLKLTNKSGKVAYDTTTVTIAADNRRVIYVDAQGNDANTGTSSDHAVRSWDRAKSLLDNNTKILFHRGDKWNASASMNIAYENVVIGAYGSGADPVINWTVAGGGSSIIGMSATKTRDVLIENLTLTSGSSSSMSPIAIRQAGENITIRGNTFGNVYDATNGNSNPTGVLIEDNVATTNVYGYFAWVQGSDYAIVGNVTQGVGLHDIRMNNFERALVADNTLHNTTRAAVGAQTGQYVYVADNTITGAVLSNGAVTATVTTGPLGGADGIAQDPQAAQRRTRFAVIEGNHLKTSQIMVLDGSELVTIRNNVIEIDNKTSISVDGYDSTYRRTAKDVKILNNTAINNAAWGKFVHVKSGAEDLTLINNLYVAPNFQTGAQSTAVIYVEDSDLSSFRQIRDNVWPQARANAYAQGGMHYVWPSWSNSQGYKDADEWESYANVNGDVYRNVTLAGYAYSVTTSGFVAGASLQRAA